MTQVAHSESNVGTPVPSLTAPICDEFAVRISYSTTTSSALEGSASSQWVGRLRRISTAKLRLWGLAPLVDDVKLLISELVTNAMRYGEGGEVEFRLVITLQGLLIAVNDGSARRPRLKTADASSETGRGLVLVAGVADDWGVTPDGTTSWCTLSLAGVCR